MIDLADLQGHWRRAWLKAPGVIDHETAVHWMQVGSLYADIRIPCPRPDVRGATALADLGRATLLDLLGAEGFAGAIRLNGDICTWERRINWHGEPTAVDAGRMRMEAWSELIEEGIHAEYSELWHRTGEETAFAERYSAGDELGFLVSVGQRFVFGFGPAEPGAPEAARAALRAGDRGSEVARQFAQGYVFGHWAGSDGVACLATNPLWEGKTVLALKTEGLAFRATDFFGRALERDFAARRAEESAA
ncbi:MAG: hypothetical protein QNJ13_15675 [Paracoccaceae bacterium]|nr:hypothetical protein [Paracoccaceae bacterium]